MARSHVRVRPADVSDVPALAELIVAAGVPLVPGASRAVLTDARAQLPRRLHDVLDDPQRVVLVAVDDSVDVLTGVVLVCDERVGDLFATNVLRVGLLVVAPEHRRRGVGKALMAAIVHLADARGLEYVVAGADGRAREANRYLSRLGFAPLIARRIATTAALRRSLNITDSPEHLALRRRARMARGTRVGGLRRGA